MTRDTDHHRRRHFCIVMTGQKRILHGHGGAIQSLQWRQLVLVAAR
jgi:hypothetical protein